MTRSRFVSLPTRASLYKLWIRLKADRNNWANDSVWVQFYGATDGAGHGVYSPGTTSGLAVNLEECSGCGVSGWGWEDDGWGAVNRNGVLLRFYAAGEFAVVVQRREDGVSIDQIVLSSEKIPHHPAGRREERHDDSPADLCGEVNGRRQSRCHSGGADAEREAGLATGFRRTSHGVRVESPTSHRGAEAPKRQARDQEHNHSRRAAVRYGEIRRVIGMCQQTLSDQHCRSRQQADLRTTTKKNVALASA